MYSVSVYLIQLKEMLLSSLLITLPTIEMNFMI